MIDRQVDRGQIIDDRLIGRQIKYRWVYGDGDGEAYRSNKKQDLQSQTWV